MGEDVAANVRGGGGNGAAADWQQVDKADAGGGSPLAAPLLGQPVSSRGAATTHHYHLSPKDGDASDDGGKDAGAAATAWKRTQVSGSSPGALIRLQVLGSCSYCRPCCC